MTDLYKLSFQVKSYFKEYETDLKDRILSFLMNRAVRTIQRYLRFNL